MVAGGDKRINYQLKKHAAPSESGPPPFTFRSFLFFVDRLRNFAQIKRKKKRKRKNATSPWPRAFCEIFASSNF